MSSRAIRKLQKLREQELQQAHLQAEQDNDESDEYEPVIRPSRPKLNAFDLLNTGDDGDEEHESDHDIEETVTHLAEDVPARVKSADSSKKKKKKNKKKKAAVAKVTATGGAPCAQSDDELDEIDRALKELAVESKGTDSQKAAAVPPENVRGASFPRTPEELLSIEPKFLNAMNEMRRLFGNVVLESFDEETGTGRRRDRNREMVDMGRALTGTTQRRNVLMQGKDEWPRAPSGGLGMELVEKLPSGATKYQIVHNSAYTDVQRQFDMCVESMDPQRMIHLLQYNPYHISTLLQVSEIAKHQGDHAVSADLLERALFNIGRSAHSSFGNRLKEGQAKLDFVHMANRELWLVGWRYIANLGMKGTWRTAYEWAKLLLSLNDDDPYCIRLLIDHLALRGREYAHFVDLCAQTRLSEDWAPLPNIQCSLALAYLRLNKPKECRQQLRRAMSRYPWVFCKLAQELDIQPMPKRIWGKMPPTDAHELLTELYIARAKDLWNTPEVVSLIVEIADTLPEEEEPIEPPEITLDIARHVVLSDIPRVTTHLPGRFVSGRISASDPLPPYDSEAHRQQSDPTPSYLAQMPEVGRPQWLRDLLDQLNNGALHFPRFRGGDNEEIRDDDLSDYDQGEAGGERRRPVADQGASLEQWLLGDGMQSLQAFLNQYGVDRGNWGDVVDYSPLTEYLDGLDAVQPDEARQELLHGRIREVMGDMVVDMLENELELQQYDDEDEV
ncbi:hypothetical protein KXV27_006013 [Aspergillus fumigatus]|uniref:Nulp1-pending protein n=2 Tax=Aspergillus fumigatus TaxID=746128 RepID=Q4WJ86_ASPFU|nr:Nulp1-pending protein [Aspergillus fumigatus Af293]EAL88396.1 Nulp1-pending protein [Aspergillus fumigatus Af293]EDP56021.1 Nulp1-pending protein [Aspergillus fumigatus A1163]KAH3042262.1 hypothetical protein KXV27_006013 [Aspergillus fumigatus]